MDRIRHTYTYAIITNVMVDTWRDQSSSWNKVDLEIVILTVQERCKVPSFIGIFPVQPFAYFNFLFTILVYDRLFLHYGNIIAAKVIVRTINALSANSSAFYRQLFHEFSLSPPFFQFQFLRHNPLTQAIIDISMIYLF